MSRIYGDWDSGRGRKTSSRSSSGGSSTSGFSIDFVNMNEINTLLEKLPEAYAEKFVKIMIKHATKPLFDDVKRRVPVSFMPHKFTFKGMFGGSRWIQPGTLLDSLGLIPMRSTRFTTMIFGPRVKGKYSMEKGGFYAWWVEFGHLDRAGNRVAARPFMRPAFDANKEVVISRFKDDAKKRFDAAVKRWTKSGKI